MKLDLVGPKVPDGFVDDGCSMSPDGWWRSACRVHDYEYHLIRSMTEQVTTLEERAARLKRSPLTYDAYMATRAEIRYLKSKIRHARRTADVNLEENIRRCSSGGPWFRRTSGWFLSRRYYGAVHRWGWKAVWGAGHQANRGKEFE